MKRTIFSTIGYIIIAFGILAAALSFTGCGRPHSSPPATVGVLLIRGAGDKLFSGGLDTLAAKIPGSRVIAYQDWQRWSAPVLIGHSAGAARAIAIAERMADAGRVVDKLFLIDCSPDNPVDPNWHTPPVPANVSECYYWISKRPNDVRPRPADGNARTVFRELDANGASHLNIDDEPGVLEFIRGTVSR